MNREQHLNDLFAKARSQAPKTSFEETKAIFVQSVASSGEQATAQKSKLFTPKNKIIMSVSFFITVTIASLLIWSNASDTKPVQVKPVEKRIQFTEDKEAKIEAKPTVKKAEAPKIRPQSNTIESAECQVPMSDAPDWQAFNWFDVAQRNSLPMTHEPLVLLGKESHRMPELTDEEIKQTVKQKKKMLKALMKPDVKVFAYIPAGNFSFLGQNISVSSFYIQKTEVSNLEYRTFLFDLVMQNRLEEFLIAKPDEAMWTKIFGVNAQVMVELYFSHPAYDNYPVNNISRAGAELYCKWLYEEVQKLAGGKELPFFHLRIPTRQEWVKAASVNGQNKSFPWAGDAIQNEKQCYLANHKPTDSTYFDDGGMFTVKVNSYLANDFGLFNMSGNVAEMVVDGVSNTIKTGPKDTSVVLSPGTAGGGWMNTAGELKISAPDNHPNQTDPHPNIGFRVVMSHRGKGQIGLEK